MTATHTTAYAWTCPAGHASAAGDPLRMIVPDGLALAPACTTCGQPMTRAEGPLEGRWRSSECCTPAGPGGTWAGPPRDPRRCPLCFGTRRQTACLDCQLVNCDGRHGDDCLACDATGTETCPACQGEGRVLDEHGDDAGPCTAPGCQDGLVLCSACGGSRRASGGRPDPRHHPA